MRGDGSVDFILDEILSHVSQVVPHDSACIFLVEEGMLRAAAFQGIPDSAELKGRQFPLDEELTSRVLSGRQPVVLADASARAAFAGWGGTGATRGWMGVPLIARSAAIGYLTLNRSHDTPFSAEEAGLAQTFANQAAMSIENARLYDEAQELLAQTRRQASQLEQLMDLIPDGVILLDGKQRIVRTNGAGASYLTQLADARVGQILTRLGSESLQKMMIAGAEGPGWYELAAVEPHGVFEASVHAVGKPDRPSGWLLLIRNVTAQRKQEGYLRAQERLASVGQLAAGIAHDFNNTMAIISLYTQLVMRTGELREVDLNRLLIIQGQAQRASELIRQILDFSRQSVVEKKPMDLSPLIREFARSLRQSLNEDIHIEAVFEDEEHFVLGDSGRLIQALNNLVSNAAVAMPEGGRLTFELSELHLATGEPFPLPDMSAGDWISLSVTDSGRGIAADDLPRVFEPFYTTNQAGGASGLGLAQVYGIVKLHNGFIDVESLPGLGTTFTLFLPAFAPQEQEPAKADDILFIGSGETILIVEDDVATREALAEYLDVLNYDVLMAANGHEALEVYGQSEKTVRLVLTDMVMPVMDGATLFARLKAINAAVKLIVITGYPLDASVIDLLEQEAVTFIQKPLRVEEVARAIRAALD